MARAGTLQGPVHVPRLSLVAALAFLLAGIAFPKWKEWWPSSGTGWWRDEFLRWSEPIDTFNYIKRVPWEYVSIETSHGRVIDSTIFENGAPIVITGSPIQSWDAMEKWNIEYFVRKIPYLFGVFVNRDNGVFIYHDKHAKDLIKHHLERGWRPTYQIENMTSETFFQSCIEEDYMDPKSFVYFSNSLENLRNLKHGSRYEERGLEQDIPSNTTKIFAVPPGFASERAQQERILWIGSTGVTNNVHFDAVHNFYAQIFGVKSFILFPPRSHRGLHLFPRSHPSWRHSRIPDINVEMSQFGKYFELSSQALRVTLAPGELLYLPPYYFHQVRAETCSISISFWTTSDEDELIQKATSLPVPFEHFWTTEQKLIAAAAFLSQLLKDFSETSQTNQKPEELLKTLLETRLRRNCNLELKHIKFHCTSEWLKSLRGKFEQYSQQIADAFAKLRSKGVAEMMILDFVEELATWAAKEPLMENNVYNVDDTVSDLLCWALSSCLPSMASE